LTIPPSSTTVLNTCRSAKFIVGPFGSDLAILPNQEQLVLYYSLFRK
jgi:hypothetical protein